MEFFKPSSPKKSQLEKIEKASKEIEKITDKLGRRIDEGITETIALLHALHIQTSGSCAGHIGEEGEEGRFVPPYIQIYTASPKGWEEDKMNKKLGDLWRQSNYEQRIIIEALLDDFNKRHATSADAKLDICPIGLFGGFNVRSVGAENILNDEHSVETIEKYQQEMSDFTEFLKDKFLNYEVE